jgi:DHA1 family inner membrane transport protein
MAYLKNSTVNFLNLHYGLHALALNGASAFFAVFLLKAGVPVPVVFAALAAILAGRFVIRPVILVLAPRCGLRALVIFGTVFSALPYFFVARAHGIDLMLWGFCVSSAIGDTFYWTSYHAYFAALGDAEHRGHQIGAREALASMAAIAGPLIGGWALNAFGAGVAFGIGGVMQIVSALPFLWTRDVSVAPRAAGGFRAASSGILIFIADGWISTMFLSVWQIALFLSLGESFSSFGGALALAALVGAVGGLMLGRGIDAGHGRNAVLLVFAGLAAAALFRAASTGSAPMAIAANAAGALAICLYQPTMMTAVYNLAKGSPCTLRFHVATEGGWDIGGASGCFMAAVLSALGVKLSLQILLSFLGMGLSFVVLSRYYGGVARSALSPLPPNLAGGEEPEDMVA